MNGEHQQYWQDIDDTNARGLDPDVAEEDVLSRWEPLEVFRARGDEGVDWELPIARFAQTVQGPGIGAFWDRLARRVVAGDLWMDDEDRSCVTPFRGRRIDRTAYETAIADLVRAARRRKLKPLQVMEERPFGGHPFLGQLEWALDVLEHSDSLHWGLQPKSPDADWFVDQIGEEFDDGATRMAIMELAELAIHADVARRLGYTPNLRVDRYWNDVEQLDRQLKTDDISEANVRLARRYVTDYRDACDALRYTFALDAMFEWMTRIEINDGDRAEPFSMPRPGDGYATSSGEDISGPLRRTNVEDYVLCAVWPAMVQDTGYMPHPTDIAAAEPMFVPPPKLTLDVYLAGVEQVARDALRSSDPFDRLYTSVIWYPAGGALHPWLTVPESQNVQTRRIFDVLANTDYPNALVDQGWRRWKVIPRHNIAGNMDYLWSDFVNAETVQEQLRAMAAAAFLSDALDVMEAAGVTARQP